MVYMYHRFLIHSSADGHLGCFHVLAMINSAAMNIGVHVSLSDLVSLVCMPRRIPPFLITATSNTQLKAQPQKSFLINKCRNHLSNCQVARKITFHLMILSKWS